MRYDRNETFGEGQRNGRSRERASVRWPPSFTDDETATVLLAICLLFRDALVRGVEPHHETDAQK